ncbi:MAG: hypothetical protein J6T51_06695 [Kiritimatiellae bacterium]|nr:hypothetical protein [Kiritimatiellia bacterium]
MKRILLAALAALCLSGSGYGATPKKEKYAIKLSPTSSVRRKTVKLYKTKDEDGKTTYRCYYKLTAQKGKAYTVWLTGKNSSNSKIRIRTAYGQDAVNYLCGDKPTADCRNRAWNVDEPLAHFEDIDCGVETRWLISGKEWSNEWSDDWDTTAWTEMIADDDWGLDWGNSTTPNTWTYYILVEGVAGATAKLNYVAKKKIPTGVASNPLVIKPKNKAQTVNLKDGFMGEFYYVQVKAKGGSCYRFGTLDGTAANKLSFDETYNLNLGVLGPYKPWAKSNNQAISFLPDGDQTVLMRLRSSKGYKAKGRIRFLVEKQKPIKKHKATALTLKKPVEFKPGYLNKPGSGYFDMIVDQQLFSLSAKKGKNYVVETSGARADVPIVAYLYDSKGNILKTNRSKGSDSPDVRVVFTPSKAAKYYIGVCEDHGIFDDFTPKNKKVSIVAVTVPSTMKTVKLSPVPGTKASKTQEADKAGSSVIALGKDNWSAKCVFGASAGVSYAFSTSFKDSKNTETNLLTALIYSGKISAKTLVKTVTVAPGSKFTYKAEKAGMYYLLVRPAAGEGLDYKPIRVHSVGYFANGKKCGALKVTLTGANGMWKLAKAKSAPQYASGASVILPVGKKTLRFTAVKGYTTPKNVNATVLSGKTVEVGDIYYTDKWDPKDDSTKKATSWSVKAKYTAQTKHTLWKTDKNDCYSFYSKKGYHYSFAIYGNGKGDQVLTIKDEKGKYYAKKVTSVSRLQLPKSNKKYYLIVSHSTNTNAGGAYKIKGRYEDLGVVKFTKPKYTAKDSATSVTVVAVRTGNKGACRVKYTLVPGSAKKGVNYIASTGYVGWKNGDKSKKKITVKLVPKTIPVKSKDLEFKVTLKDASSATVADGLKKVVQAAFPKYKSYAQATVKISNTAKYKTAAAAYASVYTDKAKKQKTQNKSRLRAGTFYGLVREGGTTLTNGAPEFGAVTLTVSAGASPSKDKLTAKVQIAGATYVFKSPDGAATGWTGKTSDGALTKTLVNVWRRRTYVPGEGEGADPVLKVEVVTNTLTLAAADGKYTDWIKSGCSADLRICIPDAAGDQADVAYAGQLHRRNAKIQTYLDAAYLFDGYYTVSLVPGTVKGTDRKAPDAGVPSGRGYLTLTVDNAGGVKVAGLLADQTPVSSSVTACGVVANKSSKTGYEMVVPVYQATSNSCFAAELHLFMLSDKGHLDGRKYKTVVDSKKAVCWNCDDGSATEDGVQGWRMSCVPVGGWYDLLANLQGYYNSMAKSFEAGAPKAFPAELLPDGYEYAATPSAVPVTLVGNKFATVKKALVADPDDPSMYDFAASVNPCDVKISFNRATGVSSGTSSAWIVNEAQGAQKQLFGFKHFGVLTIDRDTRGFVRGGLDDDVLISGALVRPVRISGRTWTFSVPFEVYAD